MKILLTILLALAIETGCYTIGMIDKVEAKDRTVTRIGNFDFVSGSDGYSGTGTRIGNFYFYNDNE